LQIQGIDAEKLIKSNNLVSAGIDAYKITKKLKILLWEAAAMNVDLNSLF